MVLGAGRGPLVNASLRAAKQADRKLRVYAVEKNPNAVVTYVHLYICFISRHMVTSLFKTSVFFLLNVSQKSSKGFFVCLLFSADWRTGSLKNGEIR